MLYKREKLSSRRQITEESLAELNFTLTANTSDYTMVQLAVREARFFGFCFNLIHFISDIHQFFHDIRSLFLDNGKKFRVSAANSTKQLVKIQS